MTSVPIEAARQRPWTVALTGGIASGKSTVSDGFAKQGITIVDTDVLARQVVAPGSSGLREIATQFGPNVLQPDGSLDRRWLRERVFEDPLARRQLERITHPRIRDAAISEVAQARSPYVVLVVPLLFEHRSAYQWVDRILVVDVSRETQLGRLRARDGISEALAEAMLSAQATREARLSIADDVIGNEGGLDTLAESITELHQDYLDRARHRLGSPR